MMEAVSTARGGDRLLQKFHPTLGRWWGVFGIVFMVLFAVEGIAVDGSGRGVLFGIGALWFSAVLWVALVRPSLHAYEDHLLLRNMVRDVRVPWHLVDRVVIRQTTRIGTSDRVYQGIAVGRSARKLLKDDARRHGGVASSSGGRGPWDSMISRPSMRDVSETDVDYSEYVEERLDQFRAEQSEVSRRRSSVSSSWAADAWVPLIGASVVLTVSIIVAAAA